MAKMLAMAITKLGEITRQSEPVQSINLEIPTPGPAEVLIAVSHCGVCHTELDEIEGRTPPCELPRIPGHQVVGKVAACGENVSEPRIGERVGVAWIFSSCEKCEWCLRGDENLCPEFTATGRDRDGGYAPYMVAPAAYVHPLPGQLDSAHVAPILCAGAIGYRSLRLSGLENGKQQRLGLTGFGVSAHLVLKLVKACFPDVKVYVFARDQRSRQHACELGAFWVGSTEDTSPQLLHAIIDTTPAWVPVLAAMRCLIPGGRLVINAIRKEDADQKSLVELDYAKQLWLEKEIKSVANVSRRDVREFLDVVAKHGIKADVRLYPLNQANQALLDMKFASLPGAAVLTV